MEQWALGNKCLTSSNNVLLVENKCIATSNKCLTSHGGQRSHLFVGEATKQYRQVASTLGAELMTSRTIAESKWMRS